MNRKSIVVGFLFLLTAVAPAASRAATFTVRPDGSGDFRTIQDAINAALPFDTILLTDGIFMGNGNRDISFLGKAVRVRSENGPSACTVDADAGILDEHHVFMFGTFESPQAILEGVTITGGWHSGGGVWIRDASPTIRNCFITGNGSGGFHANGTGAGISCEGGSPRFEDCLVFGNQAATDDGGSTHGAGARLEGSPSFTRCAFFQNSTPGPNSLGGAIYCESGSSVTFVDCEITGTAWSGGGVYADHATVVFEGCTLHDGNTGYGGRGGAYYGESSTATFFDCLLIENSSYNAGGALWAIDGSATVVNCTFSENYAENEGGSSIGLGGAATLNLSRSILAFAAYSFPVSCSGSSSLNVSCTDVYGNNGGDWVGCLAGLGGTNENLSADPLFCSPSTGEYSLRSDSPCTADNQPICGLLGSEPEGCATEDAADAGASSVGLVLSPPFPNPSRDATRVRFHLPESDSPSRVRIEIVDASGRVIRLLVDEVLAAGPHMAIWDGRDRRKTVAPSGTYYCRLHWGGLTFGEPLVHLR